MTKELKEKVERELKNSIIDSIWMDIFMFICAFNSFFSQQANVGLIFSICFAISLYSTVRRLELVREISGDEKK